MIDSHEKETLFADIVAENSRWLRIIARQNAPDDQWQDLEQDILLALWRSLDRYERRSSFATWVYAIAINTAKDFKRRRRNAERPRGFMAAEPDRTHQRATNPDPVEIADEFTRSLSNFDGYIFQMFLDDLSYREMSDATGVDEANLRKRVSRIKEQFKARYDGQ